MAGGHAAVPRRRRLTAGWPCLDVGCGDGQVTHRDGARLRARTRRRGRRRRRGGARRRARGGGAGRRDGEFVDDDAARPLGSGAFDLAYARLVLSHLVDPSAVVRAMCLRGATGRCRGRRGPVHRDAAQRAAGARARPAAGVYSATVRFHGGDPTIGPRLPALLAAAGLPTCARPPSPTGWRPRETSCSWPRNCGQHARVHPRQGRRRLTSPTSSPPTPPRRTGPTPRSSRPGPTRCPAGGPGADGDGNGRSGDRAGELRRREPRGGVVLLARRRRVPRGPAVARFRYLPGPRERRAPLGGIRGRPRPGHRDVGAGGPRRGKRAGRPRPRAWHRPRQAACRTTTSGATWSARGTASSATSARSTTRTRRCGPWAGLALSPIRHRVCRVCDRRKVSPR